jgi:hypothetical protein
LHQQFLISALKKIYYFYDNMKNILFQTFLVSLLIFISVNSLAQKIVNVHPEIAGEKINIYYDLTGIDPGQTATVRVFMSADGGKTYGTPLRSVTGDVGVVVGPGTNRCIIWDVFSDVEELVSVNVKFKVTADLLQSGQNIAVTNRKIKLDLNTNLGYRLEISRSYGFNLKGAVYLNQLGLGLRGDYYKTFGEHTELLDSGYYKGYSGGAVIEYDLLRDDRYSLYPFLCVGSSKVLYDYSTEYDKEQVFTYSIFGTAGLGFDIRIIRFFYLGMEMEYVLSPWLDLRYTKEDEKESLDGLNIGFVVKFVLDPN